MAEFNTNKQEAAATKARPFFAKYGFHPIFNNNIPLIDRSPQSLDVQRLGDKMAKLQDLLRTQVRTSQDQYEGMTNKNRTPAPAFQIRDPG